MEEQFNQAVEDLSGRVGVTEVERTLLEKADHAADELVESEKQSHLLRRYNKRIPEVLKSHGLMGIPISEKYGGNGARPLIWALAIERFGQVSLGVVTFIDVHQVLASLTIQQWGDDVQKERYLTQASTGNSILAFALTESEAGSDPAFLKTSYRRESNDYYISGSKYLVSNGSIADQTIVFAYPEGRRSDLSAFVVDNKSSGLTVDTKPIEKIGLFTSDTSTLSLDGVRVPKENLLGGEGMGLAVAYSALLNGRIAIASGCVGVMEDCLNQVRDRVRTRFQHGKLIGKHQLVQKHVSRIASHLESSRWLAYQAAIKKGEYEAEPSNKKLRAQADKLAAMAKYASSRAAFDSADSAVQLFGGFGYSMLSPVAKHLVDTRAARIFEGTDEIMELKVAASVLGEEFDAYR